MDIVRKTSRRRSGGASAGRRRRGCCPSHYARPVEAQAGGPDRRQGHGADRRGQARRDGTAGSRPRLARARDRGDPSGLRRDGRARGKAPDPAGHQRHARFGDPGNVQPRARAGRARRGLAVEGRTGRPHEHEGPPPQGAPRSAGRRGDGRIRLPPGRDAGGDQPGPLQGGHRRGPDTEALGGAGPELATRNEIERNASPSTRVGEGADRGQDAGSSSCGRRASRDADGSRRVRQRKRRFLRGRFQSKRPILPARRSPKSSRGTS